MRPATRSLLGTILWTASMTALAILAGFLIGCTAENPDYDRSLPYLDEPGDAGVVTRASLPDLAACGRVGLPCCEDARGAVFCVEGQCGAAGCYLPDLAAPVLDLARPVGTVGGLCDADGGCLPDPRCLSTYCDPTYQSAPHMPHIPTCCGRFDHDAGGVEERCF